VAPHCDALKVRWLARKNVVNWYSTN